jgi:hypothetical protein
VRAAVRALIADLNGRKPPPPIEQDDRDAQARHLLDRYYAETWALARALNEPEHR